MAGVAIVGDVHMDGGGGHGSGGDVHGGGHGSGGDMHIHGGGGHGSGGDMHIHGRGGHGSGGLDMQW